MRRFPHRQRGYAEMMVMSAIGIVAVVATLGLTTPQSNAQGDAATLFASSWTRDEIEAPPSAQKVWAAYRACWTTRESRPFTNEGMSLMSYNGQTLPNVRPAADPMSMSADGTQEFTAENLFTLCDQHVAKTMGHDEAFPVVHEQVQGLLTAREQDVVAMSPKFDDTPPGQRNANALAKSGPTLNSDMARLNYVPSPFS